MIETFKNKSVAVIGDLVADQYLNGSIARVSREAPVFILRHNETTTLPGAAANAAANIASLGGQPHLVGLVGGDANGRLLLDALENCGVKTDRIVIPESTTTTTKVRVLAGQQHAARQQVIRIDYESSGSLAADVRDRLRENAVAAAEDAAAIIISDYNYGVADGELFAAVKAVAERRKVPIIVDSRFKLGEFVGAASATPNQEEVEQILGVGFTNDDCAALCSRLGLAALLVTNGGKGMTVFEQSRSPVEIAAVGSLEPVDVTGAGDTVIAAYALSLASGSNFVEAARIANFAGGIVVMKKGTSVVTAAELERSIGSDVRFVASKV